MNPNPRRRLTPGLRRGVLVIAAAFTLAGVPAVANAAALGSAAGDAEADTAKGTALVERFFELLEDQDAAKLEKFLSPAFQLQGADGGFLDKKDFVADPPQIDSYELSDVRVTRSGKVIVVRYDVEAEVTIDGVPQSRDPAPRLSVFQDNKRWQIIAHANFNVPAEEPQQ